MSKQVLILSDFVGYGNVAMMTMRSVLTRMGFGVFCLPTAILSNTLNYGSAAALNPGDYLDRSLQTWDALGIRFDAVFVGYLANAAQAEWAAERCEQWKREGTLVFLDPIMGDHGKLYNSITPERITVMKRMLACADFCLPNETEAAFLADVPFQEDGFDPSQLAQTASRFGAMGTGCTVITGMRVDGMRCVALCSGKTGERKLLPYEPVPGEYSGAGDLFAAVFLGNILRGEGAQLSAQKAMDAVRGCILAGNADSAPGTGIPVERYPDCIAK